MVYVARALRDTESTHDLGCGQAGMPFPIINIGSAVYIVSEDNIGVCVFRHWQDSSIQRQPSPSNAYTAARTNTKTRISLHYYPHPEPLRIPIGNRIISHRYMSSRTTWRKYFVHEDKL